MDLQEEREMVVNVPRLQQQDNSSNCGLFAIANAVEICFNQYPWEKRVLFKRDKMREHLVKCFEDEKFTRFPSNKDSFNKLITRYISTTCPCRMSDSMDQLVSCRLCKLLWHKICITSNRNICHHCLKSLK